MMNYANGYGYNPYLNPQLQQQMNTVTSQYQQPQHLPNVNYVSNIQEAIATKPDLEGKPLFFYNKSANEVYIKQYDATGSAPTLTYRLAENDLTNKNEVANVITYEKDFKALNDRLDSFNERIENIKELLISDDRSKRR